MPSAQLYTHYKFACQPHQADSLFLAKLWLVVWMETKLDSSLQMNVVPLALNKDTNDDSEN